MIHTKSPHADRSELALFRELLQKKIASPSVQFNKRISDTTRPTIFSYHLPSFVKKVGPNMIQTTVKSGITELPKSELQTIICVCISADRCICVWICYIDIHTHTYTYIDLQDICKIVSHDILSRNKK